MPDTRVLYSDNDAVTVAYARELIGHNPAVTYLETDAREPAELLRAAEQHFGGQREVGIGCIGVAYLIDDASLERMLRAFHDWAAPGSVLALSQVRIGEGWWKSGRAEAIKASGTQFFPRDEAALRRLVGPWEFRELAPLEAWPGVSSPLQASDHEDNTLEMYGAVLVRAG